MEATGGSLKRSLGMVTSFYLSFMCRRAGWALAHAVIPASPMQLGSLKKTREKAKNYPIIPLTFAT